MVSINCNDVQLRGAVPPTLTEVNWRWVREWETREKQKVRKSEEEKKGNLMGFYFYIHAATRN
jgi:hypothetical protein